MKRLIWSTLLCLTVILTACGSPTSVAVSPATPVPLAVDNELAADSVVASGVIIPARTARLGFIISALVKEISVKEGDAVQTGQSLILLDTPELEYYVAAAEAAYQGASMKFELQNADTVRVINPRTGGVSYAGVPHEVRLIAQAKVAQAQSALDTAKANLALSTLLAPFDGTVISVDTIPGEVVQPGQLLITLASLGQLQIETTDLSERDIMRVKIGQSVNVFIEALNVNITGKVTRISPVAKTVGGDVVFPVIIELDEQPAGLRWGMTTEVQIRTNPE